MRWLLNLPLRRMSLTQQVSEEMVRFAARGLTGYDSAYAALATLHQATWLTFDSKARAVLGDPELVRNLSPAKRHDGGTSDARC